MGVSSDNHRVVLKVIGSHEIRPTSNSPPCDLPLTFLDLPWLLFPRPNFTLFFYRSPHRILLSTTSLSLALTRFFPLAGRLCLSRRAILCRRDDSVTFTVQECVPELFSYYCAAYAQPRTSELFNPLLPELPEKSVNAVEVPVLALKQSIFPGNGFCIGVAHHQVAADGRTINNFLKTWAALCRGSEENIISSFPVPFFDRSVIRDCDPGKLEELYLNQWRSETTEQHSARGSSNNNKVYTFRDEKVQSTFLVTGSDIDRIKAWIFDRCREKERKQPPRLSPFSITLSLIWATLIRSGGGETALTPEEPAYLGFNGSVMGRLDGATAPASFVGNYVCFARCGARCGELAGEEGVIVAAESIGRKVDELDAGVLRGAEDWISEWQVFRNMRTNGVINTNNNCNVMCYWSPKINLYETDFGCGKPEKIEEIWAPEQDGGVSLIKSRDFTGGVEFSLALPQPQMKVFTSLLKRALTHLHM